METLTDGADQPAGRPDGVIVKEEAVQADESLLRIVAVYDKASPGLPNWPNGERVRVGA